MSETEEIAKRLEPSDQKVFRQWAERHLKSGDYGGEGTAFRVRDALFNQLAFEARLKSQFEAEQAQKAADEKVAQQKEKEAQQQQDKLAQLAEQRQVVNDEIRKYFTAQAVGYETRPLFNSYGVEFSRQWVFNLKLTNKSTKTITGAAGWASISDVFNADLGSYPMRIEPHIQPGKTIDYVVVMDYDRKDPKHLEMSQTQRLKVKWFFESVAFIDGTNVDYQSIAGPPTQSAPTNAKALKKVEL